MELEVMLRHHWWLRMRMLKPVKIHQKGLEVLVLLYR